MELLTIVPIIGFVLAWQRWQETSTSVALLHTVSAVLITLFVGALIDLLLPAAVLLLAAGTLLAILESIQLYKKQMPPPVPVGILAVLSVLYWTIHSGSAYLYYDEYSHWGVFLREMLASNELWGAESNALHPRYLPGSSLWQYFFAVFSSRPEGAAYLAQFTLLLTPLLVLWERIDWKQIPWLIGVFILIVVALFNFGHGFTSLYVDHLLGAWFVGIVLNFLLDEKRGRYRQLLFYSLPLSVLVLTKTVGIFFALAAAGIMALLIVTSSVRGEALRDRGGQWRRVTTFGVATVFLCVSVLYVWSGNRNALEINGTSVDSTANVVTRLAERRSVLDDAQQTELTRRFSRILIHQQISKDEISAHYNAFSYSVMPAYTDRLRLTTVSLMGFALIAIFLLWRTILPPDGRLAWVIAAGSTWLVAVLYIAALYFGTLYLTASDEGLNFSSYIRYAHSMLLPVVLMVFAALTPAFAGSHLPPVKLSESLNVRRSSVIFIVAIAAMLVFESPHLAALYNAQQPNDFRAQTEAVTDRIRSITGDSRLWVFFPNDVENGVLGQMLQYQLSPGRVHVEERAKALIANPVSLRTEMQNWDYIWFANKNPEFQSASEVLIGQELGDGLFRIEEVDDEVQFIPVADTL